MPGRREFGVLDIKAEPLGIAMCLTQKGSTSPRAENSATTVDGARAGSPRAYSNVSLALR